VSSYSEQYSQTAGRYGCTSEQSILKYLERIVFEETRDIPLWISLKERKISLDKALDRITLIPKKWQLSYLNKPSHFEDWYFGFKASLIRDCPLPIELSSLINGSRNLAEIYSTYFYIKRDKNLRCDLISLLHTLSEENNNFNLSNFLKYNPNSSYELMVALELLLGVCGESEINHQWKSHIFTLTRHLSERFPLLSLSKEIDHKTVFILKYDYLLP
jgi:hypothetical protein